MASHRECRSVSISLSVVFLSRSLSLSVRLSFSLMWQRQYYCERYKKTIREEWLVIFAPGTRFSNFENRWKVDDETFPTLFEI